MNFMMDSGAHSLYKAYTQDKANKKFDFKFFDSKEFWAYVDGYCRYIQANEKLFDVYVSVDVIFNPEMSWKVQKYMEKEYGLHPIPVFHAGEDLKYLKRYIDNYDYVGIGGMGQFVTKSGWITTVGDPAFSLICDKKGMPRVKTHGFALTSPSILIRYPLYSADSGSWMQFGKYGLLIVPKKKGKHFVYDESPHIVVVSQRKKARKEFDHFNNLSPIDKKHIIEYVEMKGYKFGKSDLELVPHDRTKCELPISDTEVSAKEIVIEKGICNHGPWRDELNMMFYLDLAERLPKWPWAWNPKNKIASFSI